MAAARTALQNTGSGDNAEGLGDLAAMRADKAVRPTAAPKIGKHMPRHRETAAETQAATGEKTDRRAGGYPCPP